MNTHLAPRVCARAGRRLIRLIAVCAAALTAAACTGATGSLPVSRHPQTYRDRGGWSITVPPGWHAEQFSSARKGIAAAGVQISNVRLPAPSLVPGFPIQVNGEVLPADGIGLIIATDPDPRLTRGPVREPPLPAPNGRYWTMGSAPAGSPYIETLWFREHGHVYLACGKIGARVTSHQIAVLAAVIRSLR